MICPQCATGGDLHTALAAATHHIRSGLVRRINNAHGRCKGGTWCDCHHTGTPHERKTA